MQKTTNSTYAKDEIWINHAVSQQIFSQRERERERERHTHTYAHRHINVMHACTSVAIRT